MSEQFDHALERHMKRLLLIAIFVHVYRDWGIGGQLGILFSALAYAYWRAWQETRESRTPR